MTAVGATMEEAVFAWITNGETERTWDVSALQGPSEVIASVRYTHLTNY